MERIPWKELKLKKFKTSDNATLYYHEQKNCCACKNMLILLGWSQPPDGWSPVLLTNKYLRKNYNVYILVMRGYNYEHPDYGNSIARYAIDVVEFIKRKCLDNLTIMGHSMGSSIVWNIITLYGESMFEKFIMVDQPPVLLRNPQFTDNEALRLGAIFSCDEDPNRGIYGLTNVLLGPEEKANELRFNLISSMFTDKFKQENPEIMNKIFDGVFKYDNKVLSDVLYHHICNDWIRQLFLKGVNLPTLLIGGKSSIIPFQSVVEQHKYYNNASLYIFSEEEGGSHNMFIENYKLFNLILNKFLKCSDSSC